MLVAMRLLTKTKVKANAVLAAVDAGVVAAVGAVDAQKVNVPVTTSRPSHRSTAVTLPASRTSVAKRVAVHAAVAQDVPAVKIRAIENNAATIWTTTG